MKEKTKGVIFDIKRYAIHDGPGIRTTVFMKGCHLHCSWCANPESQSFMPELVFQKSECINCGKCLSICASGAISAREGDRIIHRNLCKGCGRCTAACPGEALKMIGREVTPESLYKEIVSDRIFWERSQGGVTLSGGEPLAQANFSQDFLRKCKEQHVHTAMETCLYAPERILKSLIPLTDLFICDMKIMKEEKHLRYSGVSNKPIKNNMAYLLTSPKDVLVRMPLVPGINDDEKNLVELARFLNKYRPGTRLELLPYHSFGENKYAQLGRKYEISETSPPTKEALEKAVLFLRDLGLKMTKS